MASRTTIGGLNGVIGAFIGGYLGYRQAIEVGMEQPWQGAIILGAVGLVLGSAGGFILKTLSSILMYIILLAVLAYFFRDQIEALTGIDPVSSFWTVLGDMQKMFGGG